jgi:hypothetical protein
MLILKGLLHCDGCRPEGQNGGDVRQTNQNATNDHTACWRKSTVLLKLNLTKLRRAQKMAQMAETNGVINVIRKLDKHTLNMYTAVRAGHGT